MRTSALKSASGQKKKKKKKECKSGNILIQHILITSITINLFLLVFFLASLFFAMMMILYFVWSICITWAVACTLGFAHLIMTTTILMVMIMLIEFELRDFVWLLINIIYILKALVLFPSAHHFQMVNDDEHTITISQYCLTIYVYFIKCMRALAVQLHFNFNSAIAASCECVLKKHILKTLLCSLVLFSSFDISVFLFISYSFGPSFHLWWMLREERKKNRTAIAMWMPLQLYCSREHRSERASERERRKNEEWNELIGHWEFRRYSFTFFLLLFCWTRTTFIYKVYIYMCVCAYVYFTALFRLVHCSWWILLKSHQCLLIVHLVLVQMSVCVRFSLFLSLLIPMSVSFLDCILFFRMSIIIMQKPQHIHVYNVAASESLCMCIYCILYSYNIYFTCLKIPIARQILYYL